MKKYIVSLVLIQIMTEILDERGFPRMSVQNEVAIVEAETDREAFNKCAEVAKLKHPNHNIVVRVIIDLDEALEQTLEE